MKRKICLICQPCGLGDIFYLQKIAKTYYDRGYEIWWPVIHEFEFLNDYIPWINWVSWNDKIIKLTSPPFGDDVSFPHKEYYNYNNAHIFTDDFVYINGFYRIPPGKLCMPYKYEACDLDGNDWYNYFNFNRNKQKEEKLYNALGLHKNEEYVLVNRLFQTRPTVNFYSNISIDTLSYGKTVVNWTIHDDYTPFDWCKVIENASSIVTIDTSIQYIIEVLSDKKATDYICYLRGGRDTYNNIHFLFKTPWNYINNY